MYQALLRAGRAVAEHPRPAGRGVCGLIGERNCQGGCTTRNVGSERSNRCNCRYRALDYEERKRDLVECGGPAARQVTGIAKRCGTAAGNR